MDVQPPASMAPASTSPLRREPRCRGQWSLRRRTRAPRHPGRHRGEGRGRPEYRRAPRRSVLGAAPRAFDLRPAIPRPGLLPRARRRPGDPLGGAPV